MSKKGHAEKLKELNVLSSACWLFDFWLSQLILRRSNRSLQPGPVNIVSCSPIRATCRPLPICSRGSKSGFLTVGMF
jgi:hypothetical protein